MTIQYQVIHTAQETIALQQGWRELFNADIPESLLKLHSAEIERELGLVLGPPTIIDILAPYPYVKAKLIEGYDLMRAGFFNALSLELLAVPWPFDNKEAQTEISNRDFIDTLQHAAKNAGYVVIDKKTVLELEAALTENEDKLAYWDFYLTDPGLNARFNWLLARRVQGITEIQSTPDLIV